MSRGGDFWARRKAAVEAEEAAEQAALEAQTLAQERAALEEKSDEEILAELDLPAPESLNAGDDFTAFLKKAVPDRIRRRALRVLWRSNPVLANVDALVDYGEDFTDSATVIENMQTAYQVGKGMLKHVEEMARQAEEAAATEDMHVSDAADEFEPNEEAGVEPQSEDVASLRQTETGALDAEDAPAPDEEVEFAGSFAPRRMKFRIEETA